MLDLIGIFGRGWRWRLEGVECWQGAELVARLPASLLIQIIGHYLLGVRLTSEGAALARSADAPATLPLTPLDHLPSPSSPRLQAVNGRRLKGWRAP